MSTAEPMSEKRRRHLNWIWFGYTGFLFIQPLVQPSLRLWLATLATFATFICIYLVFITADDNDRRTRSWTILATFILGLITFPWNGGASSLFVYAAAFLPFVVDSVRRVLWLFALECLAILVECYLFTTFSPYRSFHVGWPNAFIAIFLVLVIGGGNILFAEQKRAECKLRLAQEENVQLAAVAERERIARDLHDVLGHTLSVIVLKSELAKRLIELDPQRAAQEIGDVEITARTALAEVREAIGGYRSQGLVAELTHARRTLDAAGVALAWEPPQTGIPALTANEETVLCLSVREAVTNIVRHAEAKRCTMRLATTPDGFHSLLVEDDGCHAIQREGNGIRGMRERVASLGGRFSIRSEQGTRLVIELPITPPQQGTPA